jgi:SNF2 family DNA or RNA helicase
MGYADATIYDGRIMVRTTKTPDVDDFDFMLAASKKVNGGRFRERPVKHWHYPLSIETCVALRAAFGDALRVGNDLAQWYQHEKAQATDHEALSAAEDATLSEWVPKRFANWLRGYQRAGAVWLATGYRGAGLLADMPGLGKTPETLAALLEAGVNGPVLVVCPKASVRSVWGYEARRHLRGVPVYLCSGKRAKRERVLALFANHVAREPNKLRIVVVVAEMLRVKLGNPCYTYRLKEGVDAQGEVPGEWSEDGGTFTPDGRAIVVGNKIAGMCKQRFKSVDGVCRLHINDTNVIAHAQADEYDTEELIKLRKAELDKDKVPVDFEYPILFDRMAFGGWRWVILDESHKLLGSLTVKKANLMGRALKLLPYHPEDPRRYALSGTPFGMGGKVQGMFGTLHWLWPDEYSSYWKWVKDVFDTEEKVINRYGKTVIEIIGPKGLRPDATAEEESLAWERFLRSLGPRVLRRTKAEMLKDLPPKTYVEVVCELSALQEKQLRELADYAEITTPGGTLLVNGLLALRTRSQQLANGALTMNGEKAQFTQDSGKLDALWERLDARGILDGTPGPKLVIASRYNEFLDAIETMLFQEEVKMLRLDGSTNENMRQLNMGRWQGNGDERVMLVNVKAGGVSINLDAADEMHMMDEDPDPGVNEQMEDRIHRASRNHKVVIYYYRTEGTIDYLAAHNTEYRRRLQQAVLDGRRGVADQRAIESEESLASWIVEAMEGVK